MSIKYILFSHITTKTKSGLTFSQVTCTSGISPWDWWAGWAPLPCNLRDTPEPRSRTQVLCALRWKLVHELYTLYHYPTICCLVPRVLTYPQHLLDSRKFPSSLKVYVAAIVVHHSTMDGISLGAHKLSQTFWRKQGTFGSHPRAQCGISALYCSLPPLMSSSRTQNWNTFL